MVKWTKDPQLQVLNVLKKSYNYYCLNVYHGNPRDGRYFHQQIKPMTKESEQMKIKTFFVCGGSENSCFEWLYKVSF